MSLSALYQEYRQAWGTQTGEKANQHTSDTLDHLTVPFLMTAAKLSLPWHLMRKLL